jgi:hypothetical protein
MQKYFKKITLLIRCLPNYFTLTCCFLCVAIFAQSPIRGSDNFEGEFETHQIHDKFMKPFQDKNDGFNNHKNSEIRQNKDKINKENNPLLFTQQYNENPLVPYIQRFIIENQKIEENACARRIRLGIKVFTILYGATGGIPYISACCNAGQGIPFLCITFATGNVIASGAATIWAGLRIIEYFDPISKEEKEILHSSSSCCALKHTFCNVLGILASIPGTYSVYKYNLGALRFLVVPGFLNNYIFSTSGYYEITNSNSMFQQILSKFQRKDAVVKASNEIKENITYHVQNHVIPSIIKNVEARNHLFMEDTANFDITNSVKGFIKKASSLRYYLNATEPPEKWKRGCPRKSTQAASLVFPMGGAIVNYYLGYEAANLLVDSAVFCNCFSIMVIIPNFMLDVLSSTSTASSLFDSIYNKAKKKESVSFMSTFYPKLNMIIPFASVTLASLSVTGGWVVSRDAVTNSVFKDLVYVLPIVVFISNVISQSFQMRDLLHDTINYYSTSRKDSVAETVSKVNRLEKLTSIISNCVSSILYNFWNKINSSTVFTEEDEHL